MTLSRYFLKLFGSRILATLLVLLAILQILDLLDVTTDILDRKLGMAGLGTYALLRLPRLIEQAAPLSVLAGSLFAFGQLARENAVVALRATGMSVYRLTFLATPAVLVIVLLHLVVATWIAPRTDQTLESWWRATTPAADLKPRGASTFRLGPDIVVATPVDDAGRKLANITVYRRASDGRVTQRTRAATAQYTPVGWRLNAPTSELYGPLGVQISSAAAMIWTDKLHPADVRALFSKEPAATRKVSIRALEGGASARSPGFYEMQLHRTWAAPLVALVMLILTAPTAMANFRNGNGATILMLSMAAGLFFMVVDGIIVAIGESSAAPALMAAWAAPLAFAIGGITALVYLEG